MSLEQVISPKAYNDIEQIRNWYDEQSSVAGDWFLEELYLYIKKLSKNPEQYKLVTNNVRRCLMKRFPYIIFFSTKQAAIIILRVRYAKQKPLKRFS